MQCVDIAAIHPCTDIDEVLDIKVMARPWRYTYDALGRRLNMDGALDREPDAGRRLQSQIGLHRTSALAALEYLLRLVL
eukprot:9503673-Pyramimonas_sp.AAC.1